MWLIRAPDLRFDRAGLRLAGESEPRRLVFRPSPPSLFTLRHEEFTVLTLCTGAMDAQRLATEALRSGVTADHTFAAEIVDELIAAGLLLSHVDETIDQHEEH